MKSSFLKVLLLAAVALTLTLSPVVFADDPLNLLFFGNSLTFGNDVPLIVADVAEAAEAKRPLVISQTFGGWTLQDHLDYDGTSATINDTLLFTGVYLGNGQDVARHNWDFNSDGIFDFEWINYGGAGDTVTTKHVYSRVDCSLSDISCPYIKAVSKQ